MANLLSTPTLISKEVMRLLENNAVASKYINKEPDIVGDLTGVQKIGDSCLVRRPNRFIIRDGATYAAQDIVESTVTVKIDKYKGVDMLVSARDWTLTIDQFSKRYLIPACATINNQVDYDVLQAYKGIANQTGTPGTAPNAYSFLLDAAEKLDICSVPRDTLRNMIVGTAANKSLADALKGFYNPPGQVSETIRRGQISGEIAGFKGIYMDQNVAVHTVGPLGGTPLVNAANQGILVGWAEYTDLVTKAWTSAAAVRLNQGDIFTIAGVYMVNAQSRQTTGVLQQFVASSTATPEGNVSSDSGGAATVRIRPAIIAGGPHQNVTARPAADAALTIVGTAATAYPINLAIHRDAVCLVSVPFELPKGVDMAVQETYKGITISIVRWFDGATHEFKTRMDIMYGIKVLYPELACRIIG